MRPKKCLKCRARCSDPGLPLRLAVFTERLDSALRHGVSFGVSSAGTQLDSAIWGSAAPMKTRGQGQNCALRSSQETEGPKASVLNPRESNTRPFVLPDLRGIMECTHRILVTYQAASAPLMTNIPSKTLFCMHTNKTTFFPGTYTCLIQSTNPTVSKGNTSKWDLFLPECRWNGRSDGVSHVNFRSQNLCLTFLLWCSLQTKHKLSA